MSADRRFGWGLLWFLGLWLTTVGIAAVVITLEVAIYRSAPWDSPQVLLRDVRPAQRRVWFTGDRHTYYRKDRYGSPPNEQVMYWPPGTTEEMFEQRSRESQRTGGLMQTVMYDELLFGRPFVWLSIEVTLFNERSSTQFYRNTRPLQPEGESVPFQKIRFGRLFYNSFLSTTGIVAAVLWLLIVYPRIVMVRRRRAVGQCEHCGFQLGHAPGDRCPECGKRAKEPLTAHPTLRYAAESLGYGALLTASPSWRADDRTSP